MTSKNSFSKMVGEESRKLSWLTAVQLLLFGLAIPFRVLMVLASLGEPVFDGMAYTMGEKIEILCDHIGYGQMENTVLIAAAGILSAYVAFSYLHSAAKLDFYHSLPIRREKLFAVKVISSVCPFVIAYVSSQILAVVFGIAFGCMTGTIIKEMIITTIQGILFFLCSYSGTVVAVMLTGKMLTTILATVTLSFYIPLLWLIGMMYVDIFYETAFHAGVFTSQADLLRYSSPWAMCTLYRGSEQLGVTGNIPGIGYLFLVAAATAVIFAVAVLLYRIRKTESSGKALAFAKMENAVKLLLTIPAALVAAAVAYQLYGSLIWEIGFIVLFGTLACLIMEFIYRWDIHQILMHKRHIVITVAVSAIVFLVMRFDVTGYDTYLPEKSEIAAMAVKSNIENFPYEGVQGMEEGFSYAGGNEEVLDYLETEAFGPLYRLAQEGVAQVKTDPYARVYDADETVYIYLKYRLKNGKEIYRVYHVKRALYEDVMNEMMKVEGYRERFYPITNLTEEYQKSLTGYVRLYHTFQPDLVDKEEGDLTRGIPADKLDELIEAYKKDLEELTFEEVWEEYSVIYFWAERPGQYATIFYPLSSKMEHTLEVVEELFQQ